jgi:hypothetical protein
MKETPIGRPHCRDLFLDSFFAAILIISCPKKKPDSNAVRPFFFERLEC